MKKILSLILAVVMLCALSGCGGKDNLEKITLYAETGEGTDLRVSVDFFYPSDANITLEDNSEHPDWIDILYEDKNITISPAIFEGNTFDENKKYDMENQENFKEFKINGYDCYGYEAFGGYWIYVHLEELSDMTDRYLVIDTETIDYGKDFTEGIAHYEDKDVKEIIESFVYNGVVEFPAAE